MSASLIEPAIFNSETGVLREGSVSVLLGRSQAALFRHLAERYPRVVSREAILAAIGSDAELESGFKIIDVVLFRLRKSLGSAGIQCGIVRVWGAGLCLGQPVTLIPARSQRVILEGVAITRLRELLRRCAGRPADALLAEYVRQAVEARP